MCFGEYNRSCLAVVKTGIDEVAEMCTRFRLATLYGLVRQGFAPAGEGGRTTNLHQLFISKTLHCELLIGVCIFLQFHLFQRAQRWNRHADLLVRRGGLFGLCFELFGGRINRWIIDMWMWINNYYIGVDGGVGWLQDLPWGGNCATRIERCKVSLI